MFSKLRNLFNFCRRLFKNRRKLLIRIENTLSEDLSKQNQFSKLFGYWSEGLEYTDINVLRLSSSSSIGKRNRLIVFETKYPCSEKESIISLGTSCWTGVDVELNILRGCQIIIKNYSVIQDYCKILGDVTIEKYTGVASGGYISSGQHYVQWRNSDIRLNQDKIHLNDAELIKKHSRPVHIEEDCWLGYNCFIVAGVYIGRGAQIGANTVVNKDVMPYSVVSGVTGQQHHNFRFDFFPPEKIDAGFPDHRPYFYRGFRHKNGEDEIILDKNLISTDSNTCVFILQKSKIAAVKIIGKIFLLSGLEKMEIELIYNGNSRYSSLLQIKENGFFEIIMDANHFVALKQKSTDLVFRLTKNYNVFQFSYKIIGVLGKEPIATISLIEEVLL